MASNCNIAPCQSAVFSSLDKHHFHRGRRAWRVGRRTLHHGTPTAQVLCTTLGLTKAGADAPPWFTGTDDVQVTADASVSFLLPLVSVTLDSVHYGGDKQAVTEESTTTSDARDFWSLQGREVFFACGDRSKCRVSHSTCLDQLPRESQQWRPQVLESQSRPSF